jgi:hypothetical protein
VALGRELAKGGRHAHSTVLAQSAACSTHPDTGTLATVTQRENWELREDIPAFARVAQRTSEGRADS